jgi:hypothetical protein
MVSNTHTTKRFIRLPMRIARRVVSRRWGTVAALLGMMWLGAACASGAVPLDAIFPGQVGDYLRTNGPYPLAEIPDVTTAIYTGPAGEVRLNVKDVGKDQVAQALDEVPFAATQVGYDEALGQRDGVFFTYGSEYHAAWGNGDWVLVLSASSEAARIAFLASYGF